MKTSHRFLLGVLSSLLFAVGLVRAANQLDPVTRQLPQSTDDSVLTGAAYCSTYCDTGGPET